MKVHVDREKCRGYGLCYGLAPDVFELDDSGYAYTGPDDVPVASEELVLKAVKLCPERAIQISE